MLTIAPGHYVVWISAAAVSVLAILVQTLYVIALRRRLATESGDRLRLQASEARLRAITDTARDAILMIDSRGLITYWNRAAVTIFGYEPDETLGKNLHELLAPDRYMSPHLAAFSGFIRTGQGGAIGKTVELHARRKDGQEIDIALSLSALSLDHEWYAVGVVRDITAQKQAERRQEEYTIALEQQKRVMEELYTAAQAATCAKSAFLANMSHEIRTPMTGILGYADILLSELVAGDASQAHLEAARAIHRNGQHLLGLINEILDLSKIESGKLQCERIAFPPARVLAEVMSLMQVRADAKGLELTLDFDGGIPERIQTDPLRLRQILINLVGNAVKFTDTGRVRISARLVHRPERSALLQIDVVDSGVGVAADQVSQLFQPFNQADSSMTRRFCGTGLGLAISKRLAQMLGGDISVESVLGQGSTFSLTVETGDIEGVNLIRDPAKADTDSLGDSEAFAEVGRLDDCRILLAEDGADNQRLIAFVLGKAGATVTFAENGQVAYDEALRACQQGRPFDVVLMDMQMPVMDGYEATCRLRGQGYRGPIVALTAHAMEGDDLKCYEAGCDAYLTKPIDRARLVAAIDSLRRQFQGKESVSR